ncbi:MAG: hypothetical protein UX28_C0003G0067 [Candidatus Pacebacteria bacterium GW2011_GWA1_46_10]|nr:MAG: hypothetical protein UX28_C0003G0067 [Candidatus Pacebacteria bacterium GW2011_GWA1_46_10]HCR80874.1 hypothetical protein [Candidatus Paceibacterota bacterium]
MLSTFLILSAAGLSKGFSVIINKTLSAKGFRATTYTAAIQLLSAIVATPLLFIDFHITTNPIYWLLIAISVVAYAFTVYFTFKAYKLEDASTVVIIQRLTVVLASLGAIVVLHEPYSTKSLLGLLLVFLGSLVVSVRKMKLTLSLGLIFALLSTVMGAPTMILDKIILQDFSPFTYVFINNLLVGLVFALRKGLPTETKLLMKKHPKELWLTSILSTLSFALILLALKSGSVSIVMPMYKSLSFITPVFLGILLLKERHHLSQKLLGAGLGLAGILLLT